MERPERPVLESTAGALSSSSGDYVVDQFNPKEYDLW
jgi:hypothetical protein